MRRRKYVVLRKRIISVVLIIGLLLGLIPIASLSTISKAALQGDISYSYVGSNNGKATRLRGVIKDRKLLPKQKASSGAEYDADSWNNWLPLWQNGKKGTPERPFVILEVVPYYEMGSLGYSIEGCEPVPMEKLACDDNIGAFQGAIGQNFDIISPSGKIYFFDDETEGKRDFYLNSDQNNLKVTFKYDKSTWNSFIKEEPISTTVTSGKTVNGIRGYYERVAEKAGSFKYDSTNHTIKKVGSGEFGNLVWHTLNEYCRNEVTSADPNYPGFFVSNINDMSAEEFSGVKQYIKLNNIGDRFYTFREAGEGAPYIDLTGKFKYYKNKEIFARYALGLTEEQAADYSILVKTITPAELNDTTKWDGKWYNSQWIDVADLIYFYGSTKQQMITKAFQFSYPNTSEYGTKQNKLFNRIERELAGSQSVVFNDEKGFVGKYANDDTMAKYYKGKNRDIRWDAIIKIFNRVASAKNYVGLIFDETTAIRPVVNADAGSNPSLKKLVKYGRYDINNERIIKDGLDKNSEFDKAKDTGEFFGYNNNVTKLWLMCTALDPSLVKKYFVDKGMFDSSDQYNVKLKRENSSDANEKLYWNPASFYIVTENTTNTMLNDVDQGATGDYWKSLHGNLNTTLMSQYVQGHCYVFNGSGQMTQNMLTEALGVRSDYCTSFGKYIQTNAKTQSIWNELKSLYPSQNVYNRAYSEVTTEYATPWMAIRYILDLDDDVNYYYDTVKVLDIEPSVGLNTSSNPNWKLKEQNIRDMLPLYLSYDSSITIDHYTMTGFVGKILDLNSSYDMIYLGEDSSGFWTGGETSGESAIISAATTKSYLKHDDADPKKSYDYRWTNDKATAGADRTNFLDDTMDGLVYFHIGDYVYVPNQTVKPWVVSYNPTTELGFISGSNGVTRQPGNDLSGIKEDELNEFLNAGYPIVAADHLYVKGYVQDGTKDDDVSVMYRFLQDNTLSIHRENSVKSFGDLTLDSQIAANKALKPEILSTPVEYVYDQSADTKSYLPQKEGHGYLEFKFRVPDLTKYGFELYYDLDRNAKFDPDTERYIYSDDSIGLIQMAEKKLIEIDGNVVTVGAYVPDKWVGFLQWRFVVYKIGTSEKPISDIRTSVEGCSANEEKNTSKKNKIKALQIRPDILSNTGEGAPGYSADARNDGYATNLDSKSNDANARLWQEKYALVSDFDIYVHSIQYSDFTAMFKEVSESFDDKRVFRFDMGVGITDDNPDPDFLSKLHNKTIGDYKFGDYNIIVLGFGDEYGRTDLSNQYGEAEYLYYYAMVGENSILFAHDNSCFYNDKDTRFTPYVDKTLKLWNKEPWKYDERDRMYGYTSNSLLRDISGFNRYGVTSKWLADDVYSDMNELGVWGTAIKDANGEVIDFKEGEIKNSSGYFRSDIAANLEAYRSNLSYNYDYTCKPEKHGYTIFGLFKKLGGDKKTVTTWQNEGKITRNRIEYKFALVTSSGKPEDGTNGSISTGGMDNQNYLTTSAVQINKGQITQYPFTIPKNLTIAETHTQYYQLNMEDPELTVWYTIESPITKFSPQDAASNFYIYSKGNIFYTGVGHREITGGSEMELFVNLLVAAYRPKYDRPGVIITNEEAINDPINTENYVIQLDQEYNYLKKDVNNPEDISMGDNAVDGILPVTFKPVDYSGCLTVSCKVYYQKDKKHPFRVYNVNNSGGNKTRGSQATVKSETIESGNYIEIVYELNVGYEYMIEYDKLDLRSYHEIVFEVENAKAAGKPGYTYLDIQSRPLFLID